MSFAITAPDLMVAATDLAGIGSAISAANAAAPITGVVPAVSAPLEEIRSPAAVLLIPVNPLLRAVQRPRDAALHHGVTSALRSWTGGLVDN